MSRPIVIAAGGTGGHFFPAEAVATILAGRGHAIILMTDSRHGRRENGIFRDRPQFVLNGAGVAGKGLKTKLRSILALLSGTGKARRELSRIQPAAVLGFGGYPSIPPLLAARFLPSSQRPAIIIHEGNAVLGQANALLSHFSTAIATSYENVARLPQKANAVLTGMPVRAGIEALASHAYVAPTDTIRLLVWGGSLGARIFSEVVPKALAMLPEALRRRLDITQQVHDHDLPKVRQVYEAAGIHVNAAPFFDDVPERLKHTHLVIGRGGGSSIAEITMAGRPSIVVPLPIAASDEQGANGRNLEKAGAAWMIRQPDFTPPALASLLADLLGQPDRLVSAAQSAQAFSRPQAAEKLANLVESVIQP